MRALAQRELEQVGAGITAGGLQCLAMMSAIAVGSFLMGGFMDWLTYAVYHNEPQIIFTCVLGAIGSLTGGYFLFAQ